MIRKDEAIPKMKSSLDWGLSVGERAREMLTKAAGCLWMAMPTTAFEGLCVGVMENPWSSFNLLNFSMLHGNGHLGFHFVFINRCRGQISCLDDRRNRGSKYGRSLKSNVALRMLSSSLSFREDYRL